MNFKRHSSDSDKRFFFKNSGRRFLTNITIQNTDNMKDRLIVKINQRHKFSNFWEPWTLKPYCETHRTASDTICFLKDAGHVFWFKTCPGKAIICKLLLELKKIRGTNFYIFDEIDLNNSKICAFDLFLLWVDLSCNWCFEKLYLSENGAPSFWKKSFVAITSVSLKIHVESRKWPPCPAPGAPGVAKSRRLRVKVQILSWTLA